MILERAARRISTIPGSTGILPYRLPEPPGSRSCPAMTMVRRLDPTFDPKEFGFANLAAMPKPLEGDTLQTRKGEFDQQIRLRGDGPVVREVAREKAA